MAKTTKVKTTENFRTPIVAVMGHVDHGKTSLLDAIRGTKVQAGEAGGITQNTRAHQVSVGKGTDGSERFITFIDTPGHEAFSQMRERGARVADIVMLVVAADDGVQPQTKESIEFIKRAGLPVVVACNKMDLPGANTDKVKQELSREGILVEDYGGEAVFVPVSAVKNEGIQDLLEAISLVAEVHELKVQQPVQGSAEGFVLESQLHQELGPLALVVVKTGEIARGNYLVANKRVHKVRATLNEAQKQTDKGRQGEPVWLIGLEEVLPIGQNLIFFNDKDDALKLQKEIEASQVDDDKDLGAALADTDIFSQLLGAHEDRQDTETKLNVVLKADTQGTLEAIVAKLEELSFDDAKVVVYKADTGKINLKDVESAKTIKGIVLGFQVKVDGQAETLAKRERILVRTYQIIYDLIEEVEAVIKSMLQPEEEIEEVARAKVKAVFTLSDGKLVAGAEVIKGTVLKGYRAYVERKGEEIGEGKITSLRHLKNEVREAKKGIECGIMLEPQIEVQTGDDIVCFKIV